MYHVTSEHVIVSLSPPSFFLLQPLHYAGGYFYGLCAGLDGRTRSCIRVYLLFLGFISLPRRYSSVQLYAAGLRPRFNFIRLRSLGSRPRLRSSSSKRDPSSSFSSCKSSDGGSSSWSMVSVSESHEMESLLERGFPPVGVGIGIHS